MPRRLPAQHAPARGHLLRNKAVAHVREIAANALPFERTHKPKIAHPRAHDAPAELPVRPHRPRREIQNAVAVHDAPALIHGNAAVGIAVKGKAQIQPLSFDKLPQVLGAGRAAIFVDVAPVGGDAESLDFRPKRLEHGAPERPRTPISAVEPHPIAAEGAADKREQIPQIAVAPRHMIDGAADPLPLRKGKGKFPRKIALGAKQTLIRALLPARGKQLDAVVLEGVVARRDHHAEVEPLRPHEVRDGRRCRHMQQIGVGARGIQPRRERILKHIGRTAGILADDYPPALRLAPQKPADAKGMLRRERAICPPAKAVRAEISHRTSPEFSFFDIVCGRRTSA